MGMSGFHTFITDELFAGLGPVRIRRMFGPESFVRSDPLKFTSPDVAGWRRSRMPKAPPNGEPITVVPDWICEVLSLSTEAEDRGPKMDLYRRAIREMTGKDVAAVHVVFLSARRIVTV